MAANLASLGQALRQCITSREPELALSKLAWWREELARLHAGRPRHPVTRCLAPVVTAADIHALQECVERSRDRLGCFRFEDFATMADFHRAIWGELMGLLCRRLTTGDAPPPEFASDLGAAHSMTELLIEFRAWVHQGIAPIPRIPAAELAEAGETDLTDPQIRALAQHRQHLLALFAAAQARLPRSQAFDQQALLILAALDKALLAELDPPRIMTVHIRLTPLRLAWISRRVRRRIQQDQRAA